MKPLPSLERLNELFHYAPEQGTLTWKINRRAAAKAGDLVTTTDKNGYTVVRVDGELFMVHRLIWLMHCGQEPDGILDHRDRNKANNRIGNLRISNHSLNALNSEPSILKRKRLALTPCN